MSTNEQEVLDALLRNDFRYFARRAFKSVNPGETYLPNWHNDCMAWHLQKCAQREIKRLIITVPPRSMKSITTSVGFPAWILGHDPTAKLICVSYGQQLAAKHGRDTRTVMESKWYCRAFPGTRFHRRKNTESEMVTTRQGVRFATSVGGTVTGFGGNFIIFDDPINVDDAMSEAERTKVKEFYDGALYTRLNNKNDDVIILVMQRLHVDDLVSHVLDKEDWTVVNIPAIAEEDCTYETGPDQVYHRKAGEVLHPERESREVLDGLKNRLTTAKFAAQYQQTPIPPGGYIIKRDWLQTYSEAPLLESFDMIVQSWDTASAVSASSDFSVGITFGVKNGVAYVLDVVRVRLEYPDLRRRVIAEYHRQKADVLLIEQSSSGQSLLQDLRTEGPVRLSACGPRGTKRRVSRSIPPSSRPDWSCCRSGHRGLRISRPSFCRFPSREMTIRSTPYRSS